MLILDLDDTIFQTTSIQPEIFQPLVDIVENYCKKNFGIEKSKSVTEDLWHIPFDMVCKRYEIPSFIQDEFFEKMNTLNYQLKISTFKDYDELKSLDHRKVLVTTGFSKLQNAKIDALGIRSDFEKVFIDDPMDKNRIYKKGIFSNILKESGLDVRSVWVIGDNPESELKAGFELQLNTIQRLNKIQKQSSYAQFHIHSFSELKNIIIK